MEAKHTPGEWIAKETTPGSGIYNIVHGTSSATESNVIARDVLAHNAPIIMAAPGLLNALEVLVSVAESRGIPCDAARFAIERARGRTA